MRKAVVGRRGSELQTLARICAETGYLVLTLRHN